MGCGVGFSVGPNVGKEVGCAVGIGNALAKAVGTAVDGVEYENGAFVGRDDGVAPFTSVVSAVGEVVTKVDDGGLIDEDGPHEGDRVGAQVGAIDGLPKTTVGIKYSDEGKNDGVALGDKLGVSLGDRLGASFGVTLGVSLGDWLGISLGTELGVSLGLSLAANLDGLEVGLVVGIL